MKRAVIFMFLICLILLINFIHLIPIISAQSSAQSIEVDYPDEVNQNEEFSFKIKLVDFKEGIYDVKIDLISESGARIAKILNNDKWSSTYYYITEAIESDKKETFKMKAEDYTGKAGFEIKIRSSSGIVKTFPDYEIEIVKNNKVKEEKENNNEIKNIETKDIGVFMIIEAIGRAPEYLAEVLNDIITRIDNEEGVKVLSKKVNESKLMKDQKNFYTNFAEIEIEIEEILQLGKLIIKYMPAHVEIIYPEFIALTNNGWNDIFNEILLKLHGYDEVARIIQVEKEILEDKLRSVLNEKKSKSTENKNDINKKEETKSDEEVKNKEN